MDSSVAAGANRWGGRLFGVDFRAEGWITRQYFAALEVMRSLGSLKRSAGDPQRDDVSTHFGSFKLLGGYKYLPIGFFYGPQVDLFAGYANNSYDVNSSRTDGLGKANISGMLLGFGANIPINREYRFFTNANFIPFPTFGDSDGVYGSAQSTSALELEVGVKYQYTLRMTLDASFEARSAKAKFGGAVRDVSYRDNMFKFGASFNF
jgi:hypothetical protein